MPEVLAKQSMVLLNYPEDVRLPGDEPTSGRSKGISDLTMVERTRFVEALKDETIILHFESRPDERQGTSHHDHFLMLLTVPTIRPGQIQTPDDHWNPSPTRVKILSWSTKICRWP
jgi:hypothetical protein